jgi:hypothetical protein
MQEYKAVSAPDQFAGANLSSPRGRGAAGNPPNRFEQISLERDADWNPEDDPAPRTQFLRDLSQSIISYNDSPDIPFNASLNVPGLRARVLVLLRPQHP